MARRRQCKRQRKDKNKNEDIMSDLTDSVLIHILSFLNAKQAVQTSILSKRWRFLWRSLPTLEISYSHFSTFQRLGNFVSQILSLRDDSMAIHTLNFENCYYIDFSILQRTITYAVSHNLQHLLVNRTYNIEYFPSCIFSCHTLTSVDLSGFMSNGFFRDTPKQIFPNSLNWPALTSLSLKYFAFAPSDDDGCVDPFSVFKMLNTLIIDRCIVLNAQKLCISSTKLVNLTILMWSHLDETNYIGIYFGIELYAPSLHTFDFTGRYTPKLFGSKSVFSSIKHVIIDLRCYFLMPKSLETSSLLLTWLVELANIETLTFFSDTLEVLSSVPNLLKVELHSLCNLKSLKITMPNHKYYSPIPPDKMVAFLIQNSPSAKVDTINL